MLILSVSPKSVSPKSRSFLLTHDSQIPAKYHSHRYFGESHMVSHLSSQSLLFALICSRTKACSGLLGDSFPATISHVVPTWQHSYSSQKHYLPIRLQTPTPQSVAVPSRFLNVPKIHFEVTNVRKIFLLIYFFWQIFIVVGLCWSLGLWWCAKMDMVTLQRAYSLVRRISNTYWCV